MRHCLLSFPCGPGTSAQDDHLPMTPAAGGVSPLFTSMATGQLSIVSPQLSIVSPELVPELLGTSARVHMDWQRQHLDHANFRTFEAHS
jgi:hypothetical protein